MTIANPGHGVASMAISAIAWLGFSITLVIAAISLVGVAWPAVAGVATMAISMMGVAWPAVVAVTVAVAAIPMTIANPGHGVASMAISSIAWLSFSITLVIAAISMVGVGWPAVAGVATMAIPMMGVAWPAVAAVAAIPMTIADPGHRVASMA